MLRRGALFSGTCVAANFFPLGRTSGPKMIQKVIPFNMFDGAHMRVIKSVNPETKKPNRLSRAQLTLKCSACQFYWHHDALAVRCNAHKEHAQRELWLDPKWMWNQQHPFEYYKHMSAPRHPRTGWYLNREDAKSKNNEKRAAGFSTRTLRQEKERRRAARQVTGVGIYSNAWHTRFPLPT